jgi:hypothetical protein
MVPLVLVFGVSIVLSTAGDRGIVIVASFSHLRHLLVVAVIELFDTVLESERFWVVTVGLVPAL